MERRVIYKKGHGIERWCFSNIHPPINLREEDEGEEERRKMEQNHVAQKSFKYQRISQLGNRSV